MKTITTLLLLAFSLFGFAQDCKSVIPNATFQNYYTQITQLNTDLKKLDRSYEMMNTGCLLSAQVKKTAQLFSTDEFKLTFCKAAYAHTYDRDGDEAFQVYDVFTSFSNALRLYDFVQQSKPGIKAIEQITTPTVVTKPEEIVPIFGDYQYPLTLNYNGPKGCTGPVVNEEIFMSIAKKACCLPYDDSRSQYILENSKGLCLSMAQAMKLTSFIHTNSLRLTTMKALFSQIYDQGNYQSAAQLFNTTELKNDWTGTIQLTLTSPATKPVADCTATEADLNSTIKSVNAKSFPDDKMNVLRLVSKNKCFSLAQVRSLTELFISEKDKLDVMKLLYTKCPDKDHYHELSDEFIAYYYQQELLKFLNGK